MNFKIGDVVKLAPGKGPVRYEGRVGEIVGIKSVGRGIQFGVQFPSRRSTPLFVGRSKLRLVSFV